MICDALECRFNLGVLFFSYWIVNAKGVNLRDRFIFYPSSETFEKYHISHRILKQYQFFYVFSIFSFTFFSSLYAISIFLAILRRFFSALFCVSGGIKRYILFILSLRRTCTFSPRFLLRTFSLQTKHPRRFSNVSKRNFPHRKVISRPSPHFGKFRSIYMYPGVECSRSEHYFRVETCPGKNYRFTEQCTEWPTARARPLRIFTLAGIRPIPQEKRYLRFPAVSNIYIFEMYDSYVNREDSYVLRTELCWFCSFHSASIAIQISSC